MYKTGEGKDIYDIIEGMNKILTDVGWVQHYKIMSADNRLDHCIWEGSGDGTDKIYIQARVRNGERGLLYLDAMAGVDESLHVWEQPGSIQQWVKIADSKELGLQPAFTTSVDERFNYWMFADTYRIIVVVRMSIQYESMYIGFLNPIASERQYPYPMYVAGNTHSQGSRWSQNVQGSFIFPYDGSGYLRRADGTWRKFNADRTFNYLAEGTVFPYNAKNQSLIPNYKEEDSINQDNFLLIPVMLQTNNPVDINGLLRNVYWVSGTRDIDSERILVFNNKSYIVFDTKQDRGTNSYFAIEMS